MNRPGGRIVGRILIGCVAAAGLFGIVGVAPATAATPTTVGPSLEPLCDGSTGTWTLHWLINSTDDAPIVVNVTLPGLKPGSSGAIPAKKQGHINVTNVPDGYRDRGQMSVSWADGSQPNSGPVHVGPLGICSVAQVTIPTLPTVTDPPSQPGAPTTTVPSGSRSTTTLAPSDPNNPSPSTSVLAQTNGSVIAVDPGADPATSTTAGDGSTDTSEAKIALASGATSSPPPSSSSGSGTVWIVLVAFAVAAVGGAVMLVVSRRSAATATAAAGDDAES